MRITASSRGVSANFFSVSSAGGDDRLTLVLAVLGSLLRKVVDCDFRTLFMPRLLVNDGVNAVAYRVLPALSRATRRAVAVVDRVLVFIIVAVSLVLR